MGVAPIHGIIVDVCIEIGVRTGEEHRIPARPASNFRVIFAGIEMNQPRIRVVQSAGEAEGLETGIGIAGDGAPDVIVEPLGDGTGFDIDDQARAAEGVGEQAVGALLLGRRVDLDEIGRDIAAVGIDEATDHLVVAVELGDGAQLVLIEEALDQAPVAGLADAPVEAVDAVADLPARVRAVACRTGEQAILVVAGVGLAVSPLNAPKALMSRAVVRRPRCELYA